MDEELLSKIKSEQPQNMVDKRENVVDENDHDLQDEDEGENDFEQRMLKKIREVYTSVHNWFTCSRREKEQKRKIKAPLHH